MDTDARWSWMTDERRKKQDVAERRGAGSRVASRKWSSWFEFLSELFGREGTAVVALDHA